MSLKVKPRFSLYQFHVRLCDFRPAIWRLGRFQRCVFEWLEQNREIKLAADRSCSGALRPYNSSVAESQLAERLESVVPQ